MQSHLARGEPAYVEQVLHEAGEVLDLPIDDGASTLTRRLLRLRVLQDSAGVGDGPEGIAQLMPEHGEELVLRAVRPLRLLIELRVGHGDRRVMGIGGDELDVVRREGAAEERSHEEGPGDVSLVHEGNGETGAMRGRFRAGMHHPAGQGGMRMSSRILWRTVASRWSTASHTRPVPRGRETLGSRSEPRGPPRARRIRRSAVTSSPNTAATSASSKVHAFSAMCRSAASRSRVLMVCTILARLSASRWRLLA